MSATMGSGAVALAVETLTVRFGGVVALDTVDLAVNVGTRHGILGPNGSGKTTLFNAISGFVAPKTGRIRLHGEDVTRLAAPKRVHRGLSRTFQITTLFPSLTVHENVLLAVLSASGRSRGWWRPVRSEVEAGNEAVALLADLGLSPLAGRPVGTLGYGEQRQLEIALALATRPKVLLLDEPTAGLSAAETAEIANLIRRLPAELAVVMIEHDLSVVFDLADDLTVLQNGVRIADGPSAAVRDDPIVRQVYLGTP